jgi:hypothetical protein
MVPKVSYQKVENILEGIIVFKTNLLPAEKIGILFVDAELKPTNVVTYVKVIPYDFR